MKRIYVISLLFLALIASGCTSSPVKDTAAPETRENPSETSGTGDNRTVYTVEYTGSGFSPSQVTIDRGDTVRWMDSGTENMWVASDRHPTHTQLDGTSTAEHCTYPRDAERQERIGNPFDSCATVQEFSYTFNRTGTWSYHNHENPIHTGEVNVR